MIINTYPASWQAAMGIILQPIFSEMGIPLNISSLCEHLGVGRTSAYDAKQELNSRLFSMSPGQKSKQRIKELEKKLRSSQRETRLKEFQVEYYRYLSIHPDSYIKGLNSTYTEAFKQFILGLKREYGFTLSTISRLTCIPEDTLKKFRRVNDGLAPNEEVKKLPEQVIKLLNTYLRTGRGVKSVKEFCRRNPALLKELSMNYRQVLSWLSRWGFVNPKGIFLKNSGLDRIIRFNPNAVWGSDGKHITVSINGVRFHWVWQSLIDYKTTVIVGGLLSENETTDNLLEAIQASKEKTGITPLALVLDNRLSENLPAIKAWLDDYGIEIIKTFPGNPKSNGIVEGNFNIFERWVGGRVTVDADDYESLSRSIARMLVEVFTQMRNHRPRKGLGMKTPKEVMKEAKDHPPFSVYP